MSQRMLTLSQRRRLGLTVPRLVSVVNELKNEGAISKDSSNSEIAAAVLVKLAATDDAISQSIYGESSEAAVNLEMILTFIEIMLPLILKIIILL